LNLNLIDDYPDLVEEIQKLAEAQRIIEHQQDVDEDDVGGLDSLHTTTYKV